MTLQRPQWSFSAQASVWDRFAPNAGSGWPNNASAPGSITTGTNNAVGTIVTLLTTAQVTFAPQLIILELLAVIASGVTNNALVDLLYDPAGGATPTTTLVSSIPIGGVITPQTYEFMIEVPSGSSFAIRGQGNPATAIGYRANLSVHGKINSGDGLADIGTGVEAVGADRANSRGTVLQGLTLGSSFNGPWVTLGTLVNKSRYLRMGFTSGPTLTTGGTGFKVRLGYVDSAGTHDFISGMPTITLGTSTSETISQAVGGALGFIPVDLPAGTVLVVKAHQSSTTTLTTGVWPTVIAHSVF